MEWGDIAPLSTKTVRLIEGDLCVLAVNAHGLQVDDANLYCTVMLRPTNMALRTMRGRMDAVCHLYNWAASAGVDLKARIESGRLLQRDEVAALREDLRRDLREASARRRRHSRNSSNVVRFKGRPVVRNGHWRNRCAAVRDYVAWLAEEVLGRMSPKDGRLAEFRERLAAFRENILPDVTVRAGAMREGLSEEARTAFLNAITPGHPTNPFPVRHQVRNHALWLTYYDGGIRLSECVALKGGDLRLNGARPTLIVHRRPDDADDTRSTPANTKTLPHPVGLTQRLSKVLYDYVVKVRPTYKDAKRCPYVFVSQKGGRLTGQGVREMYLRLRGAVPELPEDFSTHILRYTWNDRFGDAAREAGLSEIEEKAVRNSAQGWTPDSDRGQVYSNRRNRERASEISLRMQDKAVGKEGGE
jgi:integrase